MATRPPSELQRDSIGVGTSTTIAFVAGGVLYLERMNVLAEDGAGVLSPVSPKTGDKVQVIFRLSTRKEVVRCTAEVLGDVATTPAGMKLHQKLGAKAFAKVAMAGMSDSATVMFRMSDLEAAHAAQKQAQEDEKKKEDEKAPEPPKGFCLRFLDLDKDGKEAVRHHVQTSRKMSEQLAMRGEKVLEIGENERRTMQKLLDEPDISKRALDW